VQSWRLAAARRTNPLAFFRSVVSQASTEKFETAAALKDGYNSPAVTKLGSAGDQNFAQSLTARQSMGANHFRPDSGPEQIRHLIGKGCISCFIAHDSRRNVSARSATHTRHPTSPTSNWDAQRRTGGQSPEMIIRSKRNRKEQR
jgi:hypothetical protein